MQYLHRILENSVFVATSVTSAFVAGGITLYENINSWMGLLALAASIFSALSVGIYHLWKLLVDLKGSKKRNSGAKSNPSV